MAASGTPAGVELTFVDTSTKTIACTVPEHLALVIDAVASDFARGVKRGGVEPHFATPQPSAGRYNDFDINLTGLSSLASTHAGAAAVPCRGVYITPIDASCGLMVAVAVL